MAYGRKFKAVILKPGGARRVAASKRAGSSRMAVVGAGRGFLRTGGYYGRFKGRAARSGGELKFLDTALAASAVAQAGTVAPNINVIPQDSTESGRIGRKVTIKSIWFKGMIQKDGAAATANTSDNVRIIVVQDKQANGAAFAVTDYLETANFLSHKNLANSNRFVCLSDQTFALSCPSGSYTGAAASFGEQRKTWNKYIKCNIPIEFDAAFADGRLATQRSNSVAVIYISESATISTIQYNVRIRYSDD